MWGLEQDLGGINSWTECLPVVVQMHVVTAIHVVT
jgi:hypothetical protein